MKSLKLILALSFLLLFSCSKENASSTEFLVYDENNAVEDLITLNEEIIEIAFTNRNDLDAIVDNENSAIHQRAYEMEALILEINSNNPNLNIADILSQSSENMLVQLYSEEDITEFTPCTDAFIASAFTAAIAYTVSVIASGGSSLMVSTILYYVALGTAAYNWCICMENNYPNFPGCEYL